MDTGHPSSGSAPTCSRRRRRPWTRGRRCPGNPWRGGPTCRSGSTRSAPGPRPSLASPGGRRPRSWGTRGRSGRAGRSCNKPWCRVWGPGPLLVLLVTAGGQLTRGGVSRDHLNYGAEVRAQPALPRRGQGVREVDLAPHSWHHSAGDSILYLMRC